MSEQKINVIVIGDGMPQEALRTILAEDERISIIGCGRIDASAHLIAALEAFNVVDIREQPLRPDFTRNHRPPKFLGKHLVRSRPR